MRDGPAAGIGQRHAPPNAACREEACQVTAVRGIERAESRNLTRSIAQSEPCRGRHRQVHRAGQASHPAGRDVAGADGSGPVL
jgi:hypothetical protein